MKLKVESHQIELEHIKMKDMLEEKQRQIDFNMEIIDQLKDQNAKTI